MTHFYGSKLKYDSACILGPLLVYFQSPQRSSGDVAVYIDACLRLDIFNHLNCINSWGGSRTLDIRLQS